MFKTYPLNPWNADTDGDGWSDSYEILQGTNAYNPNNYPWGGFMP